MPKSITVAIALLNSWYQTIKVGEKNNRLKRQHDEAFFGAERRSKCADQNRDGANQQGGDDRKDEPLKKINYSPRNQNDSGVHEREDAGDSNRGYVKVQPEPNRRMPRRRNVCRGSRLIGERFGGRRLVGVGIQSMRTAHTRKLGS